MPRDLNEGKVRLDEAVQTVLNENGSWKQKYPKLLAHLESKNPTVARKAKTTLIMMNNQAKFMERAMQDKMIEATFNANLNQLVPKVVDLVRIFYPNLVCNELVDIQPMDRQNGEVFIIKPVYSNSAAGVTAGQQVFRTLTDGTYASEEVGASVATADGSTTTWTVQLAPAPIRPGTMYIKDNTTVVGTDDAQGNITGVALSGTNTINYASGSLTITFASAPTSGDAITALFRYNSEVGPQNIRELELQLSLVPITATPKPIRVKWSQTAELAAAAHLDLDVPDTLANLVASFIREERDVSVINTILQAATADPTLNFDATPPTSYSRIAKYAEFELKLDYAEGQIQKTMGRGGISFILCGNNVANIIRNVNGFVPSDVVAPIGPHKIGGLRDGTLSVIKVPTMNSNAYVVGFKGYVVGDAATILGEWVPLYASPTFRSPDLVNSQGMMSLYALLVNNPGLVAANDSEYALAA